MLGPYNSLEDRCVHNHTGLPLFYLCNVDKVHYDYQLSCECTDICKLNKQDSQAYLSLVSDILPSGLPNYRSVRFQLGLPTRAYTVISWW